MAASAERNAYDPVEQVSGALDAGVLFLCDHACNSLPAAYGTLGLPPDQLQRHIGYDIGAAAMTRRLAARFGAPAVLTTFSRLLIDPNRGEDDPTLVMRLSDGAVVPGNARADAAEIAYRLEHFWRPYRATVAATIEAMTAAGPLPAVVAVHSFTPYWKGLPRPWEIGVLWDSDARFARPLIAGLAAAGFNVGDNEPYDGALEGDTLDCEVTRRGLAGLLLEARQDLVATRATAEALADRCADVLGPVLARPELHETAFPRSRTGRH